MTSSCDNALRLWDVVTRREIRSFTGPTARSRLLCFVAPKGDRIISAGDDATIRVWDTETELHCYRGHTKPISRLAFSPDGHYALSSAEDGVRLLGMPP